MDRPAEEEDTAIVARGGGGETTRRSSSSTSSSDKKPPATQSFVANRPAAQNPFAAATLQERDENFPSFERALQIDDDDDEEEENHWANSSAVSSAIADALSISARAALNEHNRQIAQYGLDDSMVQQQQQQQQQQPRDESKAPTVHPLDAEWERLLLMDKTSSSLSSVVNNRSSTSMNRSSAADLGLRFDKVVASQDAIEVMTDLSVSDYFNSSKVFLLRTPEHGRDRQQQPQVTTRGGRGGGGQDYSHTTSSEASSALDASEANLRHMCRLAGIPVPQSGLEFDEEQRQESEHPTLLFPDDAAAPAAPAVDTSFGVGLNNVDLSRISADGSQIGVDLSFNNNSSILLLNQSINSSSAGDHLITIDEILPSSSSSSVNNNNESSSICGATTTKKKTKDKVKQHLPHLGGSGSQYSSPVRGPRVNHHHSRSNDTSSSSSKSSRRRQASPPLRGSPTNSWTSSPQRGRPPLTLNNRGVGGGGGLGEGGSPTSSSSFAGKDRTPSRSPPQNKGNLDSLRLSPISKARQPKADTTDTRGTGVIDNRIGVGLSPISKRAADIAGQLINSNDDWKNPKLLKNRGPFLYPNPFEEEEDAQAQQLNVDSMHDDDDNFNLDEHDDQADKLSSVIVEYDSARQQHDDEDDISPLHSSSSDKKKNSNDSSSSRTDDLKKSSLSSISPNSSSEHHVSAKQNGSSSFSRSSKQKKQQQQQQPFSSPKSIMQTSESGGKKNKIIPSPASSNVSRSSNCTCCSGLSFAATDRRRYRTVVPTRVFMTEPSEFPFVHDSFSAPLPTSERLECTADSHHHHSA